MSHEHFTAGDAAAFLGISVTALQALIDKGQLPAHRAVHGGMWSVPKDACLEYLRKAHEQGGSRGN